MKPIVIFALWALVGWDVGAWAEAFVGIPSVVGIVVGVAIGAALAVSVRQRMAVAGRMPEVATTASSFEGATALDRAA